MWARIDGGTVAETTPIDPAGRFHPALIWKPCDAAVQVGWAYDGAAFTTPVVATPTPAIPASVSPFQARAAMHATPHGGGTLLDAVTALMSAADPVTVLAWEYATSFDRNGQLITALAPSLGLTGADLDALFTAAATIRA